jgi:hypothetical protein
LCSVDTFSLASSSILIGRSKKAPMTWSAFLQKFNCFQLGRASKSVRRAERLTAPGSFLKGALLACPAIENALQTGAPPFKKAFSGHGALTRPKGYATRRFGRH